MDYIMKYFTCYQPAILVSDEASCGTNKFVLSLIVLLPLNSCFQLCSCGEGKQNVLRLFWNQREQQRLNGENSNIYMEQQYLCQYLRVYIYVFNKQKIMRKVGFTLSVLSQAPWIMQQPLVGIAVVLPLLPL